jgi:DNA polymerase III subunit delta
MLYVFLGPDQFSAREELERLRKELDTDGNLSSQTVWLEGGKTTPAELLAASHAASFFAAHRLVIVEGLLRRLEGVRGRRRSGRRRGETAPSEVDQFLDALSELPGSTTVVLLDESAPSSIVESVKAHGQVRLFPALKREELREWTRRRVLERGGKISAQGLDRLCNLVDASNIATLAAEIDKLITYTAGRPIEVEDVDEMVSGAVNYFSWDMTDAVIAGRADRALAVVQRLSQRDSPPQVLLFMLARVYRQLILAQALLREGFSAAEIGRRLGISHPFQLQKVIDQASRYPADRLESAYRRIYETDVAVKTGVLDVELALEMLITELAQEAPRARERRSAPAASRGRR